MPRGEPGIPVSSSQKTTSMPAPEAAWGVACAQRAARGQGILVAGLLGRPRPLRVLTATSQRDLSFSRALGELQLRARPACSEHPLRVRRQRRPSGPEPGPESGSARERGGELAVLPVPGRAGVGDTADPRAALLCSGGRAPLPAQSCGGSRGPHSEWVPGWRKTAHGSQPGPCVHAQGTRGECWGVSQVSALGTARAWEGRTCGLTVSPDSDGAFTGD